MKQKKNVRANKTVHQQISDLMRTIAKHGDHDGSRAKQLEKLFAQVGTGNFWKELIETIPDDGVPVEGMLKRLQAYQARQKQQ